MSQPKKATGLDHFSRLNPAVFLHQPTTTSKTHDPDLILIAAWMDASPRHISKYAGIYEKLYPSARILVVTTNSLDAAFRSKAANENRVKPILEILYTLPADTKLLLHFFSNGGTYTSTIIARKYREKMGQPLPVSAIVLDSCPGHPIYEATVRAFTVGLPKGLLAQTIGVSVFRVFLFLYMAVHVLLRKKNVVERAREELNDKTLFELDAPRMYVYSIADEMVEWKDVEEHADDARSRGYTVEIMEKYIESGHAAHMVSDEKRYWSAVQRLWSTVA
ncbi:hypothetical protein G7Y89_g3073 [Cudoniella acicularis]|uniref:Indole-diterpene biosynthesis protein PaxU n=1 Tax=Cudoniella acicularis TaxID=354080 RepID=A0A8H4W5J3_9HELO|nr:hypothetical protein G7Y89_g3073 [Cudoniella acicularis]